MKTKTKSIKPLRGHALLKAAWNYIAKHPEKWDQNSPHINEDYGCIGSHAINLSGNGDESLATFDQFCEYAELSGNDAAYLFSDQRTLSQLRARVVKICGPRGVLPVPKV